MPTRNEIHIPRPYAGLVGWNWPERYWIITGGRGSAKSFNVGIALALQAQLSGHRILYTRYTLTSAGDSIIPEFEEKPELLGISDEFERVGANVTHRLSGSEILFRGIKTSSGNQTAKLKSLYGITVWVLDEADEMTDEEEFDKIDLSVRSTRRQNKVILCFNPPHVSHWMYRRFWKPRDLPDDFSGSVDGVRYVHTDYRCNRANLPAQQVAQLDAMALANPIRYAHIGLGHWTRDMAGALWSWGMIDPHRVIGAPALRRVVVAIDPAVTSKATSDETGIIAAGLGYDDQIFVLEDCTCRVSPLQWARNALACLARHDGDRIVAEVNNGGDLVEAVIAQADASAPYKAVHASRGKTTRAEPVAALYEKGRVHHVGPFGKLEAEMMTYTGAATDDSPNRLDALVWAITELLDGGGGPLRVWGTGG